LWGGEEGGFGFGDYMGGLKTVPFDRRGARVTTECECPLLV